MLDSDVPTSMNSGSPVSWKPKLMAAWILFRSIALPSAKVRMPAWRVAFVGTSSFIPTACWPHATRTSRQGERPHGQVHRKFHLQRFLYHFEAEPPITPGREPQTCWGSHSSNLI